MAQKFTVPITVRQLSSAGSDAFTIYVDGDTYSRLQVQAGGRLVWGAGDAASDTNLYRDAENVLKTDDTFKAAAIYANGIQIDPTGATTGNALVYDGTKFAPGEGGGGASITISDTPPSSPSSGDLWFESDTGRTFVYYDSFWVETAGSPPILQYINDLADVTITSASSGQYLKYNGTAWVNSTDTAPGLEYITSATATSGTSLSVNSCFTSTYSSYLLRATGTVSSGAYGLDLKLRASGSDTSTGYYWGVNRVDLAAGNSYDKGNNSSIYATGAITSSTTGRCSSVIEVFDPQVAQYTSIMSQSTDSRGSAAYAGISGSGQLTNTTQYDGFSLMFGGGSGTIGYLKVDVYGYRI